MKLNDKRDPLPEQFNSIDEAAEFWDTHSSADYEEYMKDVDFEVDIKRVCVITDDELAKDVISNE
ncbi:MAG: CopG family antitoxin [Pyrinomonadaceae bacterium]